MAERWIQRVRRATPRDRIFFLLVVAILFGTATSVVSVLSLGRATRVGQEAIRVELAVSQALGNVAAGRLEQGRALDDALGVASAGTPPGEGSPYWNARERFEAHTGEVWSSFQHIQTLVDAGGDRVARVDHAHNEYAAGARRVFAAIESGDLAAARLGLLALDGVERRFEAALGAILHDADRASEATLARLDAEREAAVLRVAVLTAFALLGGLAVCVRTVHLVSKLHSLEGLLPICAQCKAIRDDRGYWNQLEAFVEANSGARFTHGLCEGCVTDLKARISKSTPGAASEAAV